MTTILENAQRMMRGEAPPPPIGQLLGFVLKSIEPGRTVFEMEADERHHNPMGTLHGGIYCDLADAAMGYAYSSTLGEGETFTTVELKINFFRPVRKGKLIAEAHVVRGGSTLGYVECDVKDAEGKLLARAASTCMKLRGSASRDIAFGGKCDDRISFHGNSYSFGNGQAVRRSCQSLRTATRPLRPGGVQIIGRRRSRRRSQGQDRSDGWPERFHALRHQRPRRTAAHRGPTAESDPVRCR